jgi:hypothetical protein
MDEIDEALTNLACVISVAVSGCAASEALNVPGEPRVIDEILLNCLRFPMESSDVPNIEEAIIAVKEEDDWDEVTIDSECHFINMHDIHGKWRIDFSYHCVSGKDPESASSEMPYQIGVAGLVMMDTSVIPEEHEGEVFSAIEHIRAVLEQAYIGDVDDDDPRWKTMTSTMVH